MNIIGEKVILRAIELSDLEYLQNWANDPLIQYNLGGWHFPTNMNDQSKWFSNLNCTSNNQRFIVTDKQDVVIGMANLLNINLKDGNAEHGLIIDKKYQGKGFGKEVVLTVMKYCFEELRLVRLETTIISSNVPSITLFEKKCSWTREGLLRNWYFRNGKYHDKLIYSILLNEFIKLKEL